MPETRAAQPVADYGSADYMAELGGDYQISTVPAFTEAANVTPQPTKDADTQGEIDETTNVPRPFGQGPRFG